MTRPRFAAIVLSLITFAGCHEDPQVQEVIVPGAATALAIFTDGGTAATPTNSAGAGKNGGSITAVVTGDMNLGGSTTLASPTVPAAPTTGTVPPTTPVTGFTAPGTVIISGIVNLSPAATVLFESTSGDLVINGTIRTTDAGTDQANLQFRALNGTVYITGSIITSSSDGTDSGDRGGGVDIQAQRIIVTGTIDTRGEAGPTTGGQGGSVQLQTGVTGVILVTNSINTSGGSGPTGGLAGTIAMQASTSLKVFAPLTANGGAAESTGTPTGGAGNDIVLDGGDVDISSSIQCRGGDATGGAQGANGGNGGNATITGVAVKVYGTVDTRGGTPKATAIGAGTMDGGVGGTIVFGGDTLELGRGTWSTKGGGGVSAVGNGGAIDLQTIDGTITLGSDLDSRGGNATGSLVVAGGNGGNVTIKGDTTAAASIFHPLTVLFLASVTTTGGAGTGTGNGGQGGAVLFQTGGHITLPIAITTAGGAAVNGTGGQGGAIDVIVTRNGGAGQGDVLMTGVVNTQGGEATNGIGGSGGAVTVNTGAGSGSITSTADVTTSGARGTGTAAGGAPGTVTFTTQQGEIDLAGSITANGGNSSSAPGSATTITATAGSTSGSITSSATIVALGGSSAAGTGVDVLGGSGAAITLETLSPAGRITLGTASDITADGGAGTGTSGGGPGGTVTLRTLGQSVSISGTVVARGGNQTGGGSGGLGGQVVVNTDSDGINLGGDITLNSNGTIDVSSGTGGGGGSARNNGGGAVSPAANPALIAVIFDAGGTFAASPDGANEGIVRNLGQINARGRGTNGNGGDVYFDGRQSGGGDLVLGDAGTQNRTGTGTGLTGIFQPD